METIISYILLVIYYILIYLFNKYWYIFVESFNSILSFIGDFILFFKVRKHFSEMRKKQYE
jgi:hypothetical protein